MKPDTRKKPDTGKHCGVCEPEHFERNNYYYGKQLTVRDLEQEQRYLNEKRWLINRMALGWGVVCGLDVEWDKKSPKLVVKPGLALDCCGHEIIICEAKSVTFERYEETCQQVSQKPGAVEKFALCLEYDDCETEPVELPPQGCEKQERTEYNRIRDGFKLQIKPWKDACHKHDDEHIACLDRFKEPAKEPVKEPEKPGSPILETKQRCQTPPLHQHLCHEFKKDCAECECCACVVLATITVTPPRTNVQSSRTATAEQRQPPATEATVEFDPCTDRRLVYGNNLLYDLINCYHGDLPHIVDFSWRDTYQRQQREVDWDTFVDLMNPNKQQNNLTVTFDQEMAAASLNPHTFIVTFLHVDEGTGSIINKRIPGEIKPGWSPGGGSGWGKDRCYQATFVADEHWFNDELTSKNTQLAKGVEIEITLRGSRIFNNPGNENKPEHEQRPVKALDGEFLADKLPTGNGTQGGDFVDWFRVRPREAKPFKF